MDPTNSRARRVGRASTTERDNVHGQRRYTRMLPQIPRKLHPSVPARCLACEAPQGWLIHTTRGPKDGALICTRYGWEVRA